MRRQPMRLKSSSQGPSLALVGLSLLCAGWLLGYGLAPSSKIGKTFAWLSLTSDASLMNAHPSPHALPSWRGEQMTKKTDSVP